MIYTIGTKAEYDASLQNKTEPPFKLGPDAKYSGGYAFQNPLAAYDYIHQNKMTGYEVYGLIGSWSKDVYWNEKGGLFLINKDLRLVQL